MKKLTINLETILIITSAIILNFNVLSTQIISLPNTPIKDALFLHNISSSNITIKDCVFRASDSRLQCPDPDIRHILYSGQERQPVDYTQADFLRQSIWDHTKEDVLLIHGYAGSDGALPLTVLRDAYIANGSYNVWVLDWGALVRPPCYRAAINNMKATARCTGDLLMALRSQGLPSDRLTCVGHSLGAHVCGLISSYVMFRVHRIVALDPARPLVAAALRLTSGAANAVHVLHTNAGHYGEAGKSGHVDFCINGGRVQPFCENSGIDDQLCSHVWSVCYMAESMHAEFVKKAEPCTRRCPTGPRPGHRIGVPIPMGQFTPLTASGSYCVQADYPPFCPREAGGVGDKRCCLKAPEIKPPSTEAAVPETTTPFDIFA